MMAGNSRIFPKWWPADRLLELVAAAAALSFCAFVALVYSVKWPIALALVAFLVLLAADFFSLKLALLPIFFAIPFDRLGRVGPESPITVAKVLIAVFMLTWAASFLVKRDPRPLAVLLHSPLFLLACVALAFSFVSVVNAREYVIFLGQSLRRVNNFTLFILITTIVDSKVLLRRLLFALMLGYVFVGAFVMDEIVTGQSILTTVWGEEDVAPEFTMESETFRVAGPSGDPDFLALSVIFPTLVGLTLMLEPLSRLAKAAVLGLVLMLTIAMLATGSRGGLGALLIGAGILWLLTRMRYKWLIASAAAVVLVAGTIVLSLAGSSSAERYTGESGGTSLLYRIGWTKMALLMIEDHPFLGIGTGNFPMEYNRYVRTVPEVPRKPHWTHNSFLQTWAENGVFAFMAYAGLFVTAAGAMIRVIRRTRDPGHRRMAVLLLATVAAYFFFAGTSNVLENENYWIVFALVTVLSFLDREQAERQRSQTAAQAAE